MIHDIFSGVLKKGVQRQNTISSKKCTKKGAVYKKGGVQKRGTTGVRELHFAEMLQIPGGFE